MANYARIYQRLATRAVAQGVADLEAFVDQMLDEGASLDVIEQLLLDDLADAGPIFEKYFRAMGAAAEAGSLAAHGQGAALGGLGARESDRLLNLFETSNKREAQSRLERIVDSADPDALEVVENEAGLDQRLTWVCELKGTCNFCLPLHLKTKTRLEWKRLGLHPLTIHSTKGWLSRCMCNLIEATDSDKQELRDPLVRMEDLAAKEVKGVKGTGKRTVRDITRAGTKRAQAAVDKAKQSKEGRRMLRLLGEARLDEIEGFPRSQLITGP